MTLLRLLLDRLRSRSTELTVDVLGQPLRLAIDTRRELRRARSWTDEADLLSRMVDHTEDGDTVYDVGANIGLISLAIAAHAPGTRRVHAFEPEPTNHQHLARNIQLNGYGDRIRAHQLALGAGSGDVELFVRPGAGEGRHSIANSRGSKGSIRVPLTTIAAFARASGEPPDVLKIDVEGAEGQVLAGLEPLLVERRPRELFIEIHPGGDGERMPDGERIHNWLAARGYATGWERRQGARVQRHYR